ncbi:hypothetical protein [Gelidibacter salicanalis]|uniref:Winged helix-turn-helix transcriptional regulator n=1 Tax=Gelidibacter salicanalis TaxID=291193 RepID=A0A934KTQ9_9FLAO|nr:hypothetical protein [Gelidibacter salicanalis]MBJ7881870.1 hypothetical protein [Gelidibacter salicanalis]
MSMKTVEETVETILRLMKETPIITVKKLETHTLITRRGIEYHIDKLKKQGKLKRIGPNKGGYWQVVDK